MTQIMQNPGPPVILTAERSGTRLDHFLAAQLPAFSRARLQALVRSGHISVNGQPARPGVKLRAGDTVAVTGGSDRLLFSEIRDVAA